MSAAPHDEAILSPSDLAALRDGASVRVGGRIRRAGAELELYDALASITIGDAAGPMAGLEEGDLVIVRGELAAGPALRSPRVVASHPRPRAAPRSPFESEVSRFVDGRVGPTLVARARALAAVRSYFAEAAFVEVETPSMAPCPGLDLHLDAYAVGGSRPSRYLVTSPEYQMKRLLVGGIPRCFQIGRAFRRGERGAHHNPEFTMLEWYRAFASMEAVIADTEALVEAVFAAAGEPGSALAKLDRGRPFERLTVKDAFERHANVPESRMLELASEDTDTFFRVLVEQVEPRVAEAGHPVVLHRYPATMASLARLCPDDRRYAERFEVYAAGVELCNGFGELTDPVEQRARFEHDLAERRARGLPTYPLDERFLAALGEGMPPSAGNALGLDRLVLLSRDARSIDEVIAFPDGLL